jgi:Arc/MetJ family transcription regulator
MRTNIEIDQDLVAGAMAALGVKTKREAVTIALERVLMIERQKAALETLRGIGWDGDLDEMRTDGPAREWG